MQDSFEILFLRAFLIFFFIFWVSICRNCTITRSTWFFYFDELCTFIPIKRTSNMNYASLFLCLYTLWTKLFFFFFAKKKIQRNSKKFEDLVDKAIGYMNNFDRYSKNKKNVYQKSRISIALFFHLINI